MLENVQRGQPYRPKAEDINAYNRAARWVQSQQKKRKEPTPPQFNHENVIYVQNVGEVGIPQYGFARIKEPLILPTTANTALECHNRIYMKVDSNVEETGWWNYFHQYYHIGILLEPAPVDGGLYKCVIDGLCWCRTGAIGSPDADDPNLTPSTVWPEGNGSNFVGRAEGGGPLPIVWRSTTLVSDSVANDFCWTLVKVNGQLPEPTFIMGEVDGEKINLSTDIGLINQIRAWSSPFIEVHNGDEVGLIWSELTNQYIVIAKAC